MKGHKQLVPPEQIVKAILKYHHGVKAIMILILLIPVLLPITCSTYHI